MESPPNKPKNFPFAPSGDRAPKPADPPAPPPATSVVSHSSARVLLEQEEDSDSVKRAFRLWAILGGTVAVILILGAIAWEVYSSMTAQKKMGAIGMGLYEKTFLSLREVAIGMRLHYQEYGESATNLDAAAEQGISAIFFIDAWGEEVFLSGNTVVSKGIDRQAGTPDDLVFDIWAEKATTGRPEIVAHLATIK